MRTKGFIVAAFLVVAALMVYFSRGGASENAAAQLAVARPPPSRQGSQVVEISMLHSPDEQEWLENAVQQFVREHPEIRVRLSARPSIEAGRAILDGSEKPTLFSPADSIVTDLVNAEWRKKHDADLVAHSGQDATHAELLSPLVFVMWEDRSEALAKAFKGPLTWKTIHKVATASDAWQSIDGAGRWGSLKLGHTDPTRSCSGLEALYLMALEQYGRPRIRDVADVRQAAHLGFVRDVEQSVERVAESTESLMVDMVRFGPTRYDVAVVYESVAIQHLDNAAARWGALRVHYPAFTIWNEHPVAILQGDWVTEEQRSAARTWLGHLRGRWAQETALSYGFRPADPAVPIRTADEKYPFTRLAAYGISVDLPPAAHPIDVAVARELMAGWRAPGATE